MKIIGCGVEATEGGHIVSVRAFVSRREDIEASDVARLDALLREVAGDEGSRDTNKDMDNDTVDDSPVGASDEGSDTSGTPSGNRRRRRKPDGDDSAGVLESVPEAGADGEASTSRRRRRSAGGASVKVEHDEAGGTGDVRSEGTEAPAVEPTRRRRRASKAEEAAPDSASDNGDVQPDGRGSQHSASSSQDQGQPTGQQSPRRRRRSSDGADAGAEEGAVDNTAPGNARRRRNRADAVGGEGDAAAGRSDETPDRADGGAGDEGAGTGRRRRRGSAGDAKEAGRDISDADVLKAATEASRVILPAAVMDYLATEFSVDTVGKLPKDRRAEFVDGLRKKMKEAE